MIDDEHLRVVIGVPTFRRPEDLARLLRSLEAATAEVLDAGEADTIEVLVVDNDPDRSARDAAVGAAQTVRYVVEERPGVASVRNRILDESAGAHLLVFIDDDETPEVPDWLARLLRARREHDAHVVAGPVRTVVDGEGDPWVEAGGYFARAHRAGLSTGAPIERAATNNLLVDLSIVRRLGVRFDERFGRSGGEDSLFTSQLHRGGARMIWCAEAAVLDHLPPARRTRRHAVERTRGMASAGVRVAVALAPSRAGRARVRVRAVAIGATRIVLGMARWTIGILGRSLRWSAIGRRELARGTGAVSGAFGRVATHYGEGRETT